MSESKNGYQKWSKDIKWQPFLRIQASSFQVRSLFEVQPNKTFAKPNLVKAGEYCDSPNGNWRYTENFIPKRTYLATYYGSREGRVVFDGPVVLPAIYQRLGSKFNPRPWMSLTPMEIITARSGIRRAKGVVVIAGLGMGYQLVEVAARSKVEEIILVEISQELVDWVLPQVESLIPIPLEVIVGDAYEIVPTLTADVALIDIFPSYGNNRPELEELKRKSPHIQTFWGWGTASMW